MRLAALILAAALLLSGCAPPRAEPAPGGGPGGGISGVTVRPFKGFKAPGLEGTDAATGRLVRLSDLRGKPVYLNFWATWCAPCEKEFPDIERLYQEVGGEAHILAVNFDPGDRPEKMLEFGRRLGVTMPLVKAKYAVRDDWNILGLPTHVFIDREGRVAARWDGLMDYQRMKASLAEASK